MKDIAIDTGPLVTIITPTYNQGQFIEETIKSVLAQSYRNFEYIVIDGMSTDETPEVVERYRDRITTVVREPDNGQSDAIVKGFRMARGDLVGWINSDDILYPDCLARIVEAYQRNLESVLFYNSEIDIIADNGLLIRSMSVPIRGREHLLRKSNILIQPGSFYKRATLIQADYFDAQLRYSMDLDLWLRLLVLGRAINIGKPAVASYREWEGTKTSTGHLGLVTERLALLKTHGARSFDQSVLKLQIARVKLLAKSAIRRIAERV